ncbi:hypothetical protein N9L90_04040, partial [Planctomycetota bacterium]|nr:hypothetical protein [Planctomycetota bacterium]
MTSTDMARRQRAQAALLETLRGDAEDPGQPVDDRPRAVLAEWDLGHAIEWRAERPTTATNFGLYLGEDSFLAPWRFFSETGDVAAEQMLMDLEVGTVLIDGRTAARRPEIAAALDLGTPDEAFWSRTMGARLADGGGASAASHPGFLQLIRQVDPGEAPGGMRAYAVVPGARLRAEGRQLQVVATLAGNRGSSFTWRGTARAEDDAGRLELRVPYGVPLAASPNPWTRGGGMTLSALTVFLDGEQVPVQITDWDVATG